MLNALAVIRSFFFWGIVAPLLAGLGRDAQLLLVFLALYTCTVSGLYLLDRRLVTWEPIGSMGKSEKMRGMVALGALVAAIPMLYRFQDNSFLELFVTNSRFYIPTFVLMSRVFGSFVGRDNPHASF